MFYTFSVHVNITILYMFVLLFFHIVPADWLSRKHNPQTFSDHNPPCSAAWPSWQRGECWEAIRLHIR